MTQSTHAEARLLVDKHREILDRARSAIRERAFWSPFPEVPSRRIYGEGAAEAGRAAFEDLLNRPFPLDQPATDGQVGDEVSPYGFPLGVTYPRVTDFDSLFQAMQAAMPDWRDAGPDLRAAVCVEILARLNRRSFEMAYATMHTTGQAFVMAFQAGGPHAQDRGLEAVAHAYEEMARIPATAYWEKPHRGGALRMMKSYHVAPRGIALVIGCNTFPTWNSYPGLFASLVCGNPVLVKPSRRAVLPLAVTVATAREVLTESGFDPNLLCLAAEAPGNRLASTLALRPEVKVIDFTGSNEFGGWLQDHARQAFVCAEKAGVNTVVVDSTDDFAGLCANLAFSLSLYGGQMCTAPQNILVPRSGILTDAGWESFDGVARGIAEAITALLADNDRAVDILGAVVNPAVLARIEEATSLGEVVLPSRTVTHPQFPGATVRTPLIVRLEAGDEESYGVERFGPVAFVIATESTDHSLRIMRRTVEAHGSITASVYSTDDRVLQAAENVAVDAGVALSCNLTGQVYVNQAAAFSDFHASGANPAANAAFTDAAFVASRFRVVQSRRPWEEGTA